MESSSAEVAASSGSAESEETLTSSSSQNDVAGSEWSQDGSTSGAKPRTSKKRNYSLPDGTFSRSVTLTPSQSDPDVNAIFQTVVSTVDGQRVFKCTKCGSEYTRPYSARRHANVHLKAANVSCGICQTRLTGPLSLAAHLTDKHKGQKPPPLQIVKKITKSKSSTETSRAGNSSVKDKPTTRSSNESVIALNPPASKKPSNLDRNGNMKRKIVDNVATKEVAETVVDPPATKEPKAEPSDPPVTQERRSTRIQMRMALEASAIEEERRSTRPRKDT
ncbi:hypothetical protein PENTCL1PPCAC_9396, partial [Pristionchus entomophagus]